MKTLVYVYKRGMEAGGIEGPSERRFVSVGVGESTGIQPLSQSRLAAETGTPAGGCSSVAVGPGVAR